MVNKMVVMYEHRDLVSYIKITEKEIEIKDKLIVLLLSVRCKQIDVMTLRIFSCICICSVLREKRLGEGG